MKKSARVPVFLLIFIPCLLHFSSRAQDSPALTSAKSELWVDSVYAALDTNQRIAQLLMIRAYSTRDDRYLDSLTEIVVHHNVGGVCFFKGEPDAQARLTNCWQEKCRTPLLVAIDAEWGLGMRLDSAFDFPYQMTLGAIREDSLIYDMSGRIAADCRRMGIHMNLAPVVDINNNPENPVINLRSFGEDPANVTRKGILYLKGQQDSGILCTAKHFPGHGDTDTDSHYDLPLILHSPARLDSVELVPFRELIRSGCTGMMVAHLYIPSLEPKEGLPSTLSERVITRLLKEKLGFNGFVITDALDMQGVTKFFPPGEIEVRALEAGNDILLLPQHAGRAIDSIRVAAASGRISWDLIETKCKAVLRLKYGLGLGCTNMIKLEGLTAGLNPRSSQVLNDALFRASATLVRNENRILPVTHPDRRAIACVSIGDTGLTVFQQRLSWYFPADQFIIRPDAPGAYLDSIRSLLSAYDLVIAGNHRTNLYPKDRYGMSKEILNFINLLPSGKQTILALFGNPYILGIMQNPSSYDAIITTYQDRPESEETAAGIIAGGRPAMGMLPVSAGGFKAGTGLVTESRKLDFTLPEGLGIPQPDLRKADSLIMDGIRQQAFPGCQVLCARNGKVFYYKSFGRPDYTDTSKVADNDLYDLASVTKMAATTLAVMKLYEDGRIGLDQPMEELLPLLRNTPKGKLTIREIMAHQAGFKPWIPFYQSTLRDGKPDTAWYRKVPSGQFPVHIGDSLWLIHSIRDTLLQTIIQSEPGVYGEYKYSDLGFILLGEMIQHLTGQSIDSFLARTFYKPMGLTTLGFRPEDRFGTESIMPTEYDTIWRNRLVRGDVHDPAAAMLGGVAGHAGLFSDAFDLAALLQMLLNNGEYGGTQYLLPSTIREFTRVQYPGTGNRRGLGFDKPPVPFIEDGPVCRSASASSFGHSGFTGTYAWADPENQMIYIFLSNRVCPDAGNNKLSELNLRTRLHQVFYEMADPVQPN